MGLKDASVPPVVSPSSCRTVYSSLKVYTEQGVELFSPENLQEFEQLEASNMQKVLNLNYRISVYFTIEMYA